MQECDVCGLMYGGDRRCPGCGSLSAHPVAAGSDALPTGPLPGIEALDEVLDDLAGWGAAPPVESTSLLPFSYSTKPVQVGIALPFSFGSQGGLRSEPADPSSALDPSDSIPPASATASLEMGGIEPPVHEQPTEARDETPLLDARPMTPVDGLTREESVVRPADGHREDPTEDAGPSLSDPVDRGVVEAEPPLLAARPVSASAAIPAPSAVTTPTDPTTPSTAQSTPDGPQSAAATGSTPESAIPVSNRSAAIDREAIYSVEDETVYHDFGDAFEISEVIVDFDELMDPADSTATFDPDDLGESPDLMPARALPISDVTDPALRTSVDAGFDALVAGRWLEAAEAFRIVCEARPGDAAALNDHGLALLQKALDDHMASPTADAAEEPYFQAAILTLRQAALADRRNAVVMHNLATSLASAGRNETAIPIFRAALTLDSDDVGTMNNLASSLVGVGEVDAARSLLQRAAGLDPTCDAVLVNLRRLSGL